MSEITKWKVLAVLILLWVGLLVTRSVEDSEPQRVPLTFRSGQTVSAVKPDGESSLPVLIVSQARRDDARGTPRKNIFAPLTFPQPKKKQALRAKPPSPPPRQSAPQAPPPPSPAELAAARAKRDLSEYRVLGYSSGGGEPQAFLGRANKIYIAKAGDRLESRIEVAAISDTTITLREVQTSVEATLSYQKTK